MTDEERARLDNFIWSVGGLTDEAEIERHARAFEAAIRADEREKCAKVADAMGLDDGSWDWDPPEAHRALSARRVAAAIRAMGDS